jgi:hypothetical protein
MPARLKLPRSSEPGRPANRRRAWLLRLLAFLLAVACATPAAAAALQVASDAATARTDVRTVILAPSPREGWIRVTEFVAFRIAAASENPAFLLLQPVEGMPESVSAQPMTLRAFDRIHTHAAQLEGAFYERAREERTVARCLFGTIGANGGLPAWALLAARWPLHGPAITAVALPPESRASPQLHAVRAVKVLRAAEFSMAFRSSAMNPGERVREMVSRLREGCLIVVSGAGAASEPKDMEELATCGVAISYDAPMRAEAGAESFQMPLPGDSPEAPAALTRLYVVIPSNRVGQNSFPVSRGGAVPPQRLVNGALGAFGLSEPLRKAWAAERAGVNISFVRSEGGSATSRLTAAFQDISGDIRIAQHRSFTGAVTILAQKAGAAVLRWMWPLTAALYLLGIWAGLRVYLWLIGLARPAAFGAKYALVAALGPILTPWFMLRFAGRPDEAAIDDESEALGVLPASVYGCLARLIVWGLLICAGWAVMGGITAAALALRFD